MEGALDGLLGDSTAKSKWYINYAGKKQYVNNNNHRGADKEIVYFSIQLHCGLVQTRTSRWCRRK